MNYEIISEPNEEIKRWYLSLALGFIFILISIWIFLRPDTPYVSLAIFFSIMLSITGVLEIISFLQYRDLLNKWGLSFVIGILDLIVSITIISNTQISNADLFLTMGFVFLYRSIKLITWSTELKNYKAISWGWVFFGAIVGIVLSFLLISNRAFPPETILFFTSFAFLVLGISEVYFALVLRKLK